jgi:hypothetical protein
MNPVFSQSPFKQLIVTSNNSTMHSEIDIVSATLLDRKQAEANCYSKQASLSQPQYYYTPHQTLGESKNMLNKPNVASPISVVCEAPQSPTSSSEMVLCSSPPKLSRKRRRVQFQEMNSVHGEDDDIRESEDSVTVWYSKQELSEFKRDAKRECKRVWTENESSEIDHVYPSFKNPFAISEGVDTPASKNLKSDQELYSVRIY